MAAKELAIAVPLIALAVGGFYLWDKKVQPKVDKFEATRQMGRAAGSVLAGEVLVLLDDVLVTRHQSAEVGQPESEWRWRDEARLRVTVVDAATGSKLLTRVMEAGGACAAASGGRIWCDFEQPGLYDAKTMTRVVRADEAIAKANLGRQVPKLWRVEGSRLLQLLDDGRVAILDAATLAVTASDQVPKELRRDPIVGHDPAPGALRRHAIGSLCVEGPGSSLGLDTSVRGEDFFPPGARKKKSTAPARPVTWTVEAGQSDRAHVVRGKSRSADSFLRPRVLGAEDPPYVLHHSSLDAQRDGLQLSRLAPAGTTAWTVELGSPRCEDLQRGATWIVTTENAKRRALAIDPETGAVRWTVAF